jgi:hypothetical protein
MGFACPVCGDPQADAEHLANHVAFTALMRGGDHEAFLDERVPEWGDLDETALGERVVEYAEETEFPQVFEDTTGGDSHEHGHESGDRHTDGEHSGHRGAGRSRGMPAGAGDAERRADADGTEVPPDVRGVVEEARELTRQRREGATDGDSETE